MKWEMVRKVKKSDRRGKVNEGMGVMDRMMVKGGRGVGGDGEGLDILREEKYRV